MKTNTEYAYYKSYTFSNVFDHKKIRILVECVYSVNRMRILSSLESFLEKIQYDECL